MSSLSPFHLALSISLSSCVFDASNNAGPSTGSDGSVTANDALPPAIDSATLVSDATPDGPFSPPPICDSNDADLVLCLQFEGELSAETQVPDESAVNHTAFVRDGASVSGKHGQALQVSSALLSYIEPSPELNGAKTIEMWVKPNTTTQAYQGLLEGNSYWFYIVDGRRLACDAPNTTSNLPYSRLPVLTPNVWQHVACVFKNNKSHLYVNGVEITDKEVGPGTWTASLASDRYAFGKASIYWRNTARLDGEIDTLRAWKSTRDGMICPECAISQ